MLWKVYNVQTKYRGVQRFVVNDRYSNLEYKGQGGYGTVCSAWDNAVAECEECDGCQAGSVCRQRLVAIKQVKLGDTNTALNQRLLRELQLLRHFRNKHHILQLGEVLFIPNADSYREVYIVTEWMDTDLHSIIRSSQVLLEQQVQYMMYQALLGLATIHSSKVIHRDLSPSNILVNMDCTTKICDFGMSRGLSDGHHTMTNYVCTRWYRAPELLVGCREYTTAVDMWSFGCILAECFNRAPLFSVQQKQRDSSNSGDVAMVQAICCILGHPDDEMVNSIPPNSASWFREHHRKNPSITPADWRNVVPYASAEARDLIQSLLQWKPSCRLTVEQALRHPFFQSEQDDGAIADCAHPRFADGMGCEALSNEQLRSQIYKEMLHYHPNHEALRMAYNQQCSPTESATEFSNSMQQTGEMHHDGASDFSDSPSPMDAMGSQADRWSSSGIPQNTATMSPSIPLTIQSQLLTNTDAQSVGELQQQLQMVQQLQCLVQQQLLLQQSIQVNDRMDFDGDVEMQGCD